MLHKEAHFNPFGRRNKASKQVAHAQCDSRHTNATFELRSANSEVPSSPLAYRSVRTEGQWRQTCGCELRVTNSEVPSTWLGYRSVRTAAQRVRQPGRGGKFAFVKHAMLHERGALAAAQAGSATFYEDDGRIPNFDA